MGHWTLDDIDWPAFDASKADPDTVRIVKAASLVEHNGDLYGEYLANVFEGDEDFVAAAKRWAGEEMQHGAALARWADLADPAGISRPPASGSTAATGRSTSSARVPCAARAARS